MEHKDGIKAETHLEHWEGCQSSVREEDTGFCGHSLYHSSHFTVRGRKPSKDMPVSTGHKFHYKQTIGITIIMCVCVCVCVCG